MSSLYSPSPSSLLLSSQRATSSLIAINAIIFILWRVSLIISPSTSSSPPFMMNHFTISHRNISHRRYHTLLTSAFSQCDFSHFIGNQSALWMFGVAMGRMRMVGWKGMVITYIIGGIISNLFWLTISGKGDQKGNSHDDQNDKNGNDSDNTDDTDITSSPSALGASGSISTLITAVAILRPLLTLSLPIGPEKQNVPALAYGMAFLLVEGAQSVGDVVKRIVAIMGMERKRNDKNDDIDDEDGENSNGSDESKGDGVAHSSHWGGAMFGVLVGLWYRRINGQESPWNDIWVMIKKMLPLIETIVEKMMAR